MAPLYWLFVEQSAWIVSGISIFMMWQMGNRRWWAPIVGLFGQVFWLILALYIGQYGLLPGIAGYTIVHARNAHKWHKERGSV